jgi:hypothetical protein
LAAPLSDDGVYPTKLGLTRLPPKTIHREEAAIDCENVAPEQISIEGSPRLRSDTPDPITGGFRT